MKTLITTFALGFITCAMPAMADVPGNQKKTGTLTVQQAASMVREHAQSKTNYLFVNWLTSIDRDVARELAKHGGNINGDYLTLDGLTSIDKAVARELSRFQGYELSLDGLTSMDIDVAQSLTKFQGKKLSLDGLADTDKETVKELAKFNGDWLVLGFTSLDKEDARKFAEGEGNGLSFDKLSSIDKDVAYELSRFQGYRLSLKGLTSISKDVARELAKFSPAPRGPSKYLGLDGLTSCDRDVAHELAKFHGQLGLAALRSINSGVAREFARFQGTSLDIYNVTSIARDDMNVLRDGLRSPGTEDSYRAMMPRKLDDGTDARKLNGTLTEFHKDGSKSTETVYKNGNVAVRMEWDETGNLIKEETSPVYKSRGAELDEQSVKPTEVKDLKTEYSEAVLLFNKGRITSGREYPFNDLDWDKRIAYVRGEDEPFTGIAFSDHSDGTRLSEKSFLNGKRHGNSHSISRDGSVWGIEQFNHGEKLRWLYRLKPDSGLQDTRFKNGKQSLKLTWDKDANLIRKETF